MPIIISEKISVLFLERDGSVVSFSLHAPTSLMQEIRTTVANAYPNKERQSSLYEFSGTLLFRESP